MEKAAIRMQHLIDGLLQFSKVTTKAKKFEKTDLSKIILEAMDDLEIKIERSKARIEWTNLPTLESDGSQLRQLIKNLIDNSIKFQPAGQIPEINISGQLVENGIWTLNFKDNGIGFDEKYLTNMFKPFERLHESLGHEGHGMGLTICQKIVSRHHGSISASSTPEKGSTFFITLPEKQEENPRKIRNIVLRPTFKSSNK
jgi:light-regulated signal transduction histidine kinase (bacteriophytochrome)